MQQEQRLSAMIADLFAHDKKSKKLLMLSVKEKIPQQMAALLDLEDRELKLNAIQTNFSTKELLKKRQSPGL